MTLIDAITHILESSLAGLTEREIRRAVIEQTGLRCQPPDIPAILRSSPDRFLALADGIWRLRVVVESEAVAAGVQTLSRERIQIERPFVTHLPDLHTCIVFRLETAGPVCVKPNLAHAHG